MKKIGEMNSVFVHFHPYFFGSQVIIFFNFQKLNFHTKCFFFNPFLWEEREGLSKFQ
jgi:hypothetical protein